MIKNYIIEILIGAGVFLMLIYSSDPIIYPDSGRYLKGNLFDPPFYSSIINIMLLTFNNLNSVIILQTLFIGLSIIYFVKTTSIKFNLNISTKILVSLFLFLPIIQFYRHLLTEPFSYAFSLLFVSFVLKLIFNFNHKNLIWCSIFVILLLLVRNQFMFLYIVILLLYLGIFTLQNSKKTFTLLALSFLSIFLIHNGVVNLNKYFSKNSFEKKNLLNSNTGIFFFTYIDSIYISTNQDAKLFKNKNLSNTLTIIFKEMNERNALVKHYNGRGHFGLSFKDIDSYSQPLLENLAKKENNDVVNLKKEISTKLIKANFKKYIKHIFKKSYDSSWLFVFVPFFMVIAGMRSFLKNKSCFSLFITFISTFALANHSIVYLFGRVQPRYFIYTDFMLLVIIFITFTILLEKKIK